MKKIFETIKLKDLNLKNRLIRSATWEGIAGRDGGITEAAYKIYEELAKGGVGGIITGFTSVLTNDFYFNGMMRLSDDELIPQYKRLTDVIHAENCPVIAQLALGAYYRKTGDKSFVQTEPDNMTAEEIKYVIKAFADAAVRAEKASFDGVQIHAAHFFFLSRFISPAVNHRNDMYGGSTDKRIRILLEILEGIKSAAPKLHVTIKINSNDFTFGGIDEDECLYICKKLSEAGIDSIEISGNGTSVSGIRAHINEGYFMDFAAKLANEINTPVILVGGLRSRETMENILNNTKIEFLSLSRPLLREPDLPDKLKNNICDESTWSSCNACYSSHNHYCIFKERDQNDKT